MNKSKALERLDLLANKKDFMEYVKFYYEKPIFFGPSTYFHNKVINLIRQPDYSSLFDDELFIEYIYATLASWGMHRMGVNGAKMLDFPKFIKSIRSNKDLFLELNKFKIKDLAGKHKDEIFEKLTSLFKNLKVMHSKSNLVGNSKVMHHLLPDLVPPIDRQYTIRFFYGNLTSKNTPSYNLNQELGIFRDIVEYFNRLRTKLDLTENDYDKSENFKFNTSIPKVIDNAIIGLIQKEKSLKMEVK